MSRVLVVDDEETVRTLLQAHLRQMGHRVLAAASAGEALAAVREHGPPEVAVLDVRLPDIHGFDLAQVLRAEAGCGELPIIFLSANVEEEAIAQGRGLGAVYLTKPYVRSALCNAIEKAVTGPGDW